MSSLNILSHHPTDLCSSRITSIFCREKWWRIFLPSCKYDRHPRRHRLLFNISICFYKKQPTTICRHAVWWSYLIVTGMRLRSSFCCEGSRKVLRTCLFPDLLGKLYKNQRKQRTLKDNTGKRVFVKTYHYHTPAYKASPAHTFDVGWMLEDYIL